MLVFFFRKTNSPKQIYRDGKGLKICFGDDIFLHKSVFLVVLPIRARDLINVFTTIGLI